MEEASWRRHLGDIWEASADIWDDLGPSGRHWGGVWEASGRHLEALWGSGWPRSMRRHKVDKTIVFYSL